MAKAGGVEGTMTQSVAPNPPRLRRWLRRLAQFAIVVLIFADLIVMLVAYFNYRDQQRLAAITAELDRKSVE